MANGCCFYSIKAVGYVWLFWYIMCNIAAHAVVLIMAVYAEYIMTQTSTNTLFREPYHLYNNSIDQID